MAGTKQELNLAFSFIICDTCVVRKGGKAVVKEDLGKRGLGWNLGQGKKVKRVMVERSRKDREKQRERGCQPLDMLSCGPLPAGSLCPTLQACGTGSTFMFLLAIKQLSHAPIVHQVTDATRALMLWA